MTEIRNTIVIEAMSKFRGDRAILQLSRETKLSRITLNAWSLGQLPDLGVLLKHYFMGTAEGKLLAYTLLVLLHPDVAKRLPIAE
jgi:hypothetical protein